MNVITDDTSVSELRAAFHNLDARFSCTFSEGGVKVVLVTCSKDSLQFEGQTIASVLDHALQTARVAYYQAKVTELLTSAKLEIPNDADPGSKRAKGFILDALGTLTK